MSSNPSDLARRVNARVEKDVAYMHAMERLERGELDWAEVVQELRTAYSQAEIKHKPRERAMETNPFRDAQGLMPMTVEDRCDMVRHFDLAQCRAALALTNLQKGVIDTLERRIRRLQKEAA